MAPYLSSARCGGGAVRGGRECPGRDPQGGLGGGSLVWLKLIYPKCTQINEALSAVSSLPL